MGDVQSNRIRKVLTTVALTGLLALAACSGTGEATWQNNGTTPAKGAAAGAVTITAPANGATDVPAGTQIAYTASDTAQTDVVVTDAGGQKVAGGAGYDTNTWVPDQALDYGKQYTVKVTSTGTDGKAATATTCVHHDGAPSKTIRFQSWYADHQVLGVAAPLVFKLSGPGVSSKADRAAVQKRLSVETTPKQDGSWYWFSEHRAALPLEGSLDTRYENQRRRPHRRCADGRWLLRPQRSDPRRQHHHQAADHQHRRQDPHADRGSGRQGQEDAGIARQEGHSVILRQHGDHDPEHPGDFDSSLGTGGTPVDAPGGYKVLVYWTMRLTWGGEFIHAAPWSVAQQGHSDASHGCTNLSTANAKWIYENSHVGDPVTVKNTGTRAEVGQRLDRLGRELGRLRQGQRAAGGVSPATRPADFATWNAPRNSPHRADIA